MARQYEQHRPSDPPEDETPAPIPTGGGSSGQDQQVDALLDEIDDVLETNAESFVRGFVQKGGQ